MAGVAEEGCAGVSESRQTLLHGLSAQSVRLLPCVT